MRALISIRRQAFAALIGAAIGIAGCGGTTTGVTLSYLVVRGGDQTAEAGAALSAVVVRVTDEGGKPQSGVRLRAAPRTGGSVNPTETTTGTNGEAAFLWTLGATVGGHELLVENLNTNTAFSVWAVARAPAVASISINPPGANLAAGETQQFAATLLDARGNPITGRSVAWSSSNPTVASVSGFNGLVTAMAGGTTIITAASETKSATATVTVVSGTPTSLGVTTQPAGATSGNVFAVQPVVALRDAAGGTAISAPPVPITVSIQSGAGVLSGTTTVLTENGVARFSGLRITGLGLHTLVFTTTGLPSVTSAAFLVGEVTSGALGIATTALPNATQGSPYAASLVATGGSGNYAWSLASGSPPNGITLGANGLLSGTPSAAGTSSFTVQVTSGAESAIAVLSLTVVAASGGQTPTQLTIVTQPGGAVSGANFTSQPAVAVRDAQGALVGSPSTAVTASIASGTGTLSGTTTVFSVNGVATFTNLRITGTGAHTLTFSSAGLTGATSAAFTVAAGGGGGGGSAALHVGATTPQSVQATQNISIPIILEMSNSGGANVASIQFVVTWDAARFDFVSGTVNGGSGFSLTPNTTNTANGTISVAGFAVTGVTTTTTLYTIVLTARAGAANTSSNVTVSVGAAADQLGASVTITPRNLTVNITP